MNKTAITTTLTRTVAGVIGAAAIAGAVVGCSDSKGGQPQASTPSVAGGGTTSVKVGGQDLPGLDLKSVTCVKAGGKINVASAAIGGQQGLGVVMSDEATPKVESLGLVVDGNALAVASMGGANSGKADVKVDGSTYTISGQAVGADMKNPMAGMITKDFTITVTCK